MHSQNQVLYLVINIIPGFFYHVRHGVGSRNFEHRCPKKIMQASDTHLAMIRFLSSAVFIQLVQIHFISSAHLLGGRPCLRLSSIGRHSRIFLGYLLPFNLARCPAHLYFALDIRSSSTSVFLRTTSFRILRLILIPSVERSIFRCFLCILQADVLVRLVVSTT